MVETTQDTSMSIADKRKVIMDVMGVGHNTVVQLTDAQVEVAYKRAMQEAEKASPATPATTPPVTRRNKGGPVQKRPQMMHGGAYKGKKHAYTAGGSVHSMNMGRKK